MTIFMNSAIDGQLGEDEFDELLENDAAINACRPWTLPTGRWRVLDSSCNNEISLLA